MSTDALTKGATAPTAYGTTTTPEAHSGQGTSTVPPPTTAAETPSSKFTCLKYGMFLLCGFLLCLVLRNNAIQFLSKLPGLSSGCSDERCYGTQGVYRVSFSLLLFYLFHYLMATSYNLCMDPATRVAFQTVGLKWKVPVFLLTLFVSFFLPNGFFVGYGWFSLIASALFLIAQVLVLIDFAYAWNEEWVGKAEESEQSSNKWAWGLLICSSSLLILGFTLIGFCYSWFPCEQGKTFTSLTLILNVFAIILSVRTTHGSVVPSSLVLMYNVILCFTAMTSMPGECNTLLGGSNSTGMQWWVIVINSVVSAVSVTYSAVSSAHSRGTFSLEDPANAEEDACSPYSHFHGMMMLASCYLAMLLSSWDITGTTHDGGFDSSATSMWVKMTCSWVTIGLYLWTLIAPSIFPERFST